MQSYVLDGMSASGYKRDYWDNTDCQEPHQRPDGSELFGKITRSDDRSKPVTTYVGLCM